SVQPYTSIEAITPPLPSGTYDVRVVTPGGSSAPGGASFMVMGGTSPSITALSSSGGSTAGGYEVRIFGSNFTGLTAVNFGTTPAASFWAVSDSEIHAVAPPHASGAVNISVTTTSGTSSNTSADDFTFSAASAPS